jgi:hypothetical protein
VKESDSGACNSAIDARNYDKALSVCTSRKDKASAYMGKAGYDIINMLKSSGSSATAYTAPSGVLLGNDDVAGASILNILQLSVEVIADNDTRAKKIAESKTYLDLASSKLQPSLADNTSTPPPLDADEILLNTFAISFAMQLEQIMIFDNETTSKTTFPSGENLDCTPVENVADAASVLIPNDGHIWEKERDGMMCARIKNAIEALGDQTAAIAGLAGGSLHSDIFETVCDPFDSLTTYLTDLTANIAKLSLSGDNTKAITNAKTSTETLMKAVGCKE